MALSTRQGGILGVPNPTSNGGNIVYSQTSTGCHTTQPGTAAISVLVVAGGGGGGGGNCPGGGAGAGGAFITENISVSGGTAYPVVIGGGGAGANSNPVSGSK